MSNQALSLRETEKSPPYLTGLKADCIRDLSHSDFLKVVYQKKFTFAKPSDFAVLILQPIIKNHQGTTTKPKSALYVEMWPPRLKIQ